jgi:drug/metabolite transporter (DMT)-like permease
MSRRLQFVLVLLGLGIGWGSTQALGKIAVSTGHGLFGLIFWQLAIAVAALGAIRALRPGPMRVTRPALAMCVAVALVGTLVPGTTFYLSIARLPAGIMSILIATVPLLAFPIAVFLGLDRFGVRRALGLLCGFVGMLLIAIPEAALPPGARVAWLLIAMIGPLCYALEGNIIARWGTGGLDPLETILVASGVALLVALPVMLATGQWIDPRPPWGAPEVALVAGALVNALMYVGYVWLARAAGPVFAAQTGYVVTLAGVGWAMLLLGERFAPAVWLAVALLLAGLALVRPREATDAGNPAAREREVPQ